MVKKLILLWSALGLLAACGPDSGGGDNGPLPESLAKVIAEATTGLLPRDGVVLVRFNQPMVSSGLGEVLTDNPFEFNPGVSGKAMWREDSLLVFAPDAPWPASTNFSALLHLDRLKLSAFSWPSGTPNEFRFRFATAGREIVSLDTDYDLRTPTDPASLYLRGRIEFNEPVSADELSRGLKLRDGDSELKLDFKPASDKAWDFASEPLRRLETVDKTLVLRAENLGLSEPVEQRIPLGASSRLSWQELELREADSGLTAVLTFSDPLLETQNTDGFLTVSPDIPLKIKKSKNRLTVEGDFQHGETYTFRLEPGLKSRFGTQLTEAVEKQLVVDDLKPEVSFVSSGAFLTSASGQHLLFRAQSLSKVRVQVTRVFENNWTSFLQMNELKSPRDRRQYFSGLERVGIELPEQILPLTNERNKVITGDLDLAKLLGTNDRGLFIIELRFEKEDMLWNFDEEAQLEGDDYWNDPSGNGYLYRHGRVTKALAATDIGLTWKAAGKDHWVWATDLVTGAPLGGVNISLVSYQNQVLAKGTTGGDGLVQLNNVDKEVFYVQGERGKERSAVKAGEMDWNLSSFPTGGVEVAGDGTKGFVYLDRGIYRPGDSINLSLILRHPDHSFPDGLPVSLSLSNPQGKVVSEKTSTAGKEGFYTFALKTADNDPTGTWSVKLVAGQAEFYQNIPVETIVPNRLKVKLEAGAKRLSARDSGVSGTLSSTWLFGAPAAGLPAKLTAYLETRFLNFGDWPGYTFGHEGTRWEGLSTTLFEDQALDGKGQRSFTWKMPDLNAVPTALSLSLYGAVSEKGGREVLQSLEIPLDPWSTYAGIKLPEADYGYYQLGQKLTAGLIAVSPEGKTKAGRKLTARLYKNSRWWWWEYDDHNAFQLRYKTDTSTRLVWEKEVRSAAQAASLDIVPDSWGEYLLEVEDEGGHRAGQFFRASSWGADGADSGEGLIALKTDKNNYQGGENAKLSLPTPGKANLLVTVEKAGRILSSQWIPTADKLTVFNLPVTAEMAPNVYVTVSLIQNHASTLNDRPLRMYGVANLNVTDPSTKDELVLTTSPVLKPNQNFEVNVATKSGKPLTFTLSVVDEGVLDLTNFATPDPWEGFFAKERLAVRTSDLFGQVVGAVRQDAFKAFSVGGSEALAKAREAADSTKKRFEIVSLFQGPIETDAGGKAKVTFKMPAYMGSVRIMAIGAKGKRYAHGELTVPVRDKLVLLPSLPRVLGPDESVKIPVTVFATQPQVGSTRVSIETSGPVSVVGAREGRLSFDAPASQDLAFSLRSQAAVGKALVKITASAGGFSTVSETWLDVRASSVPEYRTLRQTLPPGGSAAFDVPAPELAGSGSVSLTLSRRQSLNLRGRLNQLIDYPYGCVEQTVSAAFPQLWLKEVTGASLAQRGAMDENIKAAIQRLRLFQTADGGLSYWPGESAVSGWGTNYAGHFLLEARKLGYVVPDGLLSGWKKYQQAAAKAGRGDLFTRAYRVYLLALAGEPAHGAMNLLKENSLAALGDPEKWMLAAAYQLTGDRSTATSLLAKAGRQARTYNQPDESWGSPVRDSALLLDLAVLFGKASLSDELFEELSQALASGDWFSTQTLGYSLMALGKYLGQFPAEAAPLEGTVTWNGKSQPFSTNKGQVTLDLPEAFGQRVTVSTKESHRTFAVLSWQGLPLVSQDKAEAEGLKLTLDWLDEGGKTLTPTVLRQGSEFWGRLTLTRTGLRTGELKDLAVSQILPSGWELENLRVTGEPLPAWSEKLNLGHEAYSDLRDDRINWFGAFPAGASTLHYLFKVRAVSVGEFRLPSTLAGLMYDNSVRAVYPGRSVAVTDGK